MKAFFFLLPALLAVVLLFGVAGREGFLFFKNAGCPWKKVPFYLCYALVVLAITGAFFASYAWEKMPHGLAVGAQVAMGVLLVFVLVMDMLALIFLIAGLFHHRKAMTGLPRLIPGGIALMLSVGLSVYGTLHALAVQTKTVSVTLDKECAPLRCVLISDIHLGQVTGARRLEKIKDKIDALHPDIILIAGDIFDSSLSYLNDPDDALRVFSSIRAPMGVWACPGNHDAGDTYPAMLAFLEKAGVHLMRDEVFTVDDRLVVAGRRDSRPIATSEERRPLSLDASPLPVIVLDHQPQNYTEYSSDVDLVLCGHTHRGQFFPGNLITHALYDVDYGLYQKDASSPRVLVTSGVGFWGPVLRIGTDSEIVLIELQGK